MNRLSFDELIAERFRSSTWSSLWGYSFRGVFSSVPDALLFMKKSYRDHVAIS